MPAHPPESPRQTQTGQSAVASSSKERAGVGAGEALLRQSGTACFWLLVAGGACSREPTAAPPPAASPSALSSVVSTVRAPLRARVPIPQGSFSSGTEPGLFERQPALEPRPTRTALGPFEIDVEPYPGSGASALLGLSRTQAAERCSERRGRLCTELEWERACKGPDSSPYPSGRALDVACASPPGCASGFGVWGMGAAPEWTASELPGRDKRAIVRGAASDAPAARHRCARRDARSGEATPGLGFRCCYGPPNAARVFVPPSGRAFVEGSLPITELARLLESDPVTRKLARAVSYFDPADAARAVLAHGRGERPGFKLTTAPLVWNPAAGVELLVVAGRSGPSTSFVAVFDALGDGRRLLASSFVMEGEPGPVALLYETSVRGKLRFSTCAGCASETGKIVYEDPDRPLILQP